MRRKGIICCLLLLSGCTSPLQQLKDANPSASDYSGSLASEYLAYADSESEQGRSSIANHCADKGLKASRGESVEPDPADTSLPAADQQALADARTKLLSLTTDDMKHIAPQKLARAQLLFDCWQQEVSRRINQETAPCADGFASSLMELQEVADGLQYTDETTYNIGFAKGHSHLSKQSRAAIHQIARRVTRFDDYKIVITGNAGSDNEQAKLDEARMNAVHQGFLAAGIDETHLKLATRDNAKAVTLSDDAPEKNDHVITITVKIRK